MPKEKIGSPEDRQELAGEVKKIRQDRDEARAKSGTLGSKIRGVLSMDNSSDHFSREADSLQFRSRIKMSEGKKQIEDKFVKDVSLEAIASGLDINEYTKARLLGATPEGIKNLLENFHTDGGDIKKQQWIIELYAETLKAGATNEEIGEVLTGGLSFDHYSQYRKVGLSHVDAVEAFTINIPTGNEGGGLYVEPKHYKALKDYGVPANEIADFYSGKLFEGARSFYPPLNMNQYVSLRSVGTTQEEVVDLIKLSSEDERGKRKDRVTLDILIEPYSRARSEGISHEDFMDLMEKAKDAHRGNTNYRQDSLVAHLVDFMVERIPEEETLSFVLDPEFLDLESTTYISARKLGLSKEDIRKMGSMPREGDGRIFYNRVEEYLRVRIAGATHEEAMEVEDAYSYLYAEARRVGATHKETMESMQYGYGLYSQVRGTGFSHEEAMMLAPYGKDKSNDYYVAVSWTKDVKKVLELFKSGIDLKNYGLARQRGLSHEEILNAQQVTPRG